jgi:hypothetical protein
MRQKNADQLAYEEDCRRQPHYHDGTPRKAWDALGYAERDTWRRNPTPREYPDRLIVTRSFYETLRTRLGPHATRNFVSE